ncbi:MAG: hypothetical protein HRT44_00455 [Bdellovibrionales bacterium]|nr:hypothetical protein [Bdellovibrionales bacterium]NQZ17723.1 hypothetical protein [Bdellovibrionales bacterium]
MKKFDLSELKDLPGSLELYYSTEIHSGIKDHRSLIRESIRNQISKNGFEVTDQILDFSQLPQHEKLSINLSHCKHASGFAVVDKKYSIGFDVEEQARSNEKLIGRIAGAIEISKTPDPKALLSAKEACWKAISEAHGISTISQIETISWKSVTQNWSEYEVLFDKKPINGRGFVTEQSGIYISFYIAPSTFV